MVWIAMEAIGKFQSTEKIFKIKILIIRTTLTARWSKKINMKMRAKQESFRMTTCSKIAKTKIRAFILI